MPTDHPPITTSPENEESNTINPRSLYVLRLGMRVRAHVSIHGMAEGKIVSISCENNFEEVSIQFDHLDKPVGPYTPNQIILLDDIPCLMDQTWTTRDILKKLSEATDILFDQKNYDGHGWEEIQHCNNIAKQLLTE